MGNCKGIKWDRYIHRVRKGGFSQGRLAPAVRIQRLLNAFEASIAIAAMNSGPSVEFYVRVHRRGQKSAATAQFVKGEQLTS